MLAFTVPRGPESGVVHVWEGRVALSSIVADAGSDPAAVCWSTTRIDDHRRVKSTPADRTSMLSAGGRTMDTISPVEPFTSSQGDHSPSARP